MHHPVAEIFVAQQSLSDDGDLVRRQWLEHPLLGFSNRVGPFETSRVEQVLLPLNDLLNRLGGKQVAAHTIPVNAGA